MPLLYLVLAIALIVLLRALLKQPSSAGNEKIKRTLSWAVILGAGGFLLKLIGGRLIPVLNAVMFFAPFFAPLLERWSSQYRTNPSTPATSEMSREEARKVLGVSATASEAEILEAYKRLMRKNHPDGGGTDYLAQKINQARDVLVKENLE
jgi:hypothetical protein